MKTLVISGGTDGIGKGIAIDALEKGHTVIIIGRNDQKGKSFLEKAEQIDAKERAFFLHADLSIVSENQKVIAELESKFQTIDILVLCAQHGRTERSETAEGFEHTFALYYLSRFILSYGLRNQMRHSDNPMIINICGSGIEAGTIHWDDLQLTKNYIDMSTSLMQGSRLNDLLGIEFAEKNKDNKIKYVLFNPGGVSTSFSGEYDEFTKSQIEQFKKLAKPVEEGIKPIVNLIENPPNKPISAYMEGNEISLNHNSFDKGNAMRLYSITEKLLHERCKGSLFS